MISIPVLMAAVLGVANIDVAVAERTGPSSAKLTLVKGDRRLEAICPEESSLKPDGLDELATKVAEKPIWLYLGPRRVAKGRLTASGLEAERSVSGQCAIVGEANFDGPIPIVAQSDLLWASTRDSGSQSRQPAQKNVAERAHSALPQDLASACLSPALTVVRGTKDGAFVGFVCPDEDAQSSVLLFVPKGKGKESATIVLQDSGETGPLILIDVLDPARTRRKHTLAVSRELESGRRVELWGFDGQKAERLD